MKIEKYLVWRIIGHLDNIIVQNLMWSDQVPSEYWAIAGTGEDYPSINEDLSILYHFDNDAPVQDFSMMVTDLQNHQSLSSNPVDKLNDKQVNQLNKKILHTMKVFAKFGKISTKKLKHLTCSQFERTRKVLSHFKKDLPTHIKNKTNKKKAYINLFINEATSLRHLPVNKQKAKHAIVQYINKNFTKVNNDLSTKPKSIPADKISDINDKHLDVNSTVESVLLHYHVVTHKQLNKALDMDLNDL